MTARLLIFLTTLWSGHLGHDVSAAQLEEVILANGQLADTWDEGIAAFDEAIGYGNCANDGGAGCPTVDWRWVNNPENGNVLRASWANNGQHAGIYFKSSTPQDFTALANGSLDFDIRTVAGAADLVMKVDCVWPCSSGDQRLSNRVTSKWQRFSVPISRLLASGLELAHVDTGLVFWPADRVAIDLEIDNVIWRTSKPVTDDDNDDQDTGLGLSGLSGPTSPDTYEGYSLLWSDEFSGTQLDRSYWNYNIGDSGWGNNEWQYYQRQNVSLSDGYLVISAKRESKGNSDYTSARIKTEGQFDFTYGRVDIRATLPRGQGIWPALWALGSNFSDVGWPYSGEIDIMEMIGGAGREDTVHGTVHWNVGGLNSPYAHTYTGGAFTGQDFSAGFNVFSIIRDSKKIEWRVNDEPYYQFNLDDTASLAPFKKPFFLIFNVAVGGNWPGYPDASTEFPQRMIVDYVRVFEPVGATQNQDTDGDGISDENEAINGTDPNDSDTDGDDLTDGEEGQYGTDPLNSDSDYDSLPDGEEVALGTDPLKQDSDEDGLDDDVEIEIETDPLDADSDDDGLLDGYEMEISTSPLDADSDADGFKDGEEVSAGTNPLDSESSTDSSALGRLETPAANSPITGKNLISGWHCTALEIEVSINSDAPLLAATRTARDDTAETCGDSDNGFAVLFNFGELPSGTHRVRAYADGLLFADQTFSSIQLSAGSFIRDRSSEVVVHAFPTPDREVVLRWEQSLQNFVIVEERVSQ